jgi:hypothetical protein
LKAVGDGLTNAGALDFGHQDHINAGAIQRAQASVQIARYIVQVVAQHKLRVHLLTRPALLRHQQHPHPQLTIDD